MSDKKETYLCGSSFLTIICKAMKTYKPEGLVPLKGDNKNTLNEFDVLRGLNDVADVNRIVKYPQASSYKTSVSKYKKGEKYTGEGLPYMKREFYIAFDKAVKESYVTELESMNRFCQDYLSIVDEEEMNKLTARLLKLVENDNHFDLIDKFYVIPTGKPVSVRTMLSLPTICLPALLLGLWHYIVVNRKNTSDGKDYIQNAIFISEEDISLPQDKELIVSLTEKEKDNTGSSTVYEYDEYGNKVPVDKSDSFEDRNSESKETAGITIENINADNRKLNIEIKNVVTGTVNGDVNFND